MSTDPAHPIEVPSLLKQNLVHAVLFSFLATGSLHAQSSSATNSEAQAIRTEMQQMQKEYEQRLQAMEQRLKQLEAASTNQPAPTATAGDTNDLALAQSTKAYVDQQFKHNTETREWALSQEEKQPVKERVEQVLNNFIDIGGYFRAGYGRDDQGGPQPAFQAPGAFAKYRLGNEAETYGELVFGKNWYSPELFALDPGTRTDVMPDGPIARTQIRVAFFDPIASSGSTATFQTSLPEAWAEVGNVIPAQPSLKFWGGARYYRRQDIHINDFFFYNMSGVGGGFEDLELPFGKVALAWIGHGAQSGVYSSGITAMPDPNNLAGFSKQSFDLSLYDVPVPWGKAEFGLVGSLENSGLDSNNVQAPDSDGVSLTFLHTHEHFLCDDGINKFSLQFGTGAAKTFTSGYETATITTATVTNGTFIIPDNRSSWRFRLTESFVTQPWEHLSISPALVYQYTDYHTTQETVQWFSAGCRPIYHFNQHFSLAFEGGADYVVDGALDQSGTLYKLTLAPQVSLGGRFFSRPVIRAFLTYAAWSENFEGRIGGNDYANETSGLTWGIQMESWW